MVSFRSQQSLSHTQIGLLQGLHSNFPTTILSPLYGSQNNDDFISIPIYREGISIKALQLNKIIIKKQT